MKWSSRVNSGLGGGVVCLTEQTLEAGFMEAEGCGSIVKKKTFKCKQAGYFLSCEGDEKGD